MVNYDMSKSLKCRGKIVFFEKLEKYYFDGHSVCCALSQKLDKFEFDVINFVSAPVKPLIQAETRRAFLFGDNLYV